MKHWLTLDAGRKLLYLIAAVLPIPGLFPFLRTPDLIPPGPAGGIVWLCLVPPALGFLLGLANLALIFSGRPPRENCGLWDGLLAASLVPDLALLGFDLFIMLIQHGVWPVPT